MGVEGSSPNALHYTMTRILTRADVQQLIDPHALLQQFRAAFQHYSLNRSVSAQRPHSSLADSDHGVVALLPGLDEDIPAFSVKVQALFPHPKAATAPTTGLVQLFSTDTGELIGLMDASVITSLRTGLTGALAADLLARPDAQRVAIIGAGVQGRWQLRGLQFVRDIRHVSVFDTSPFKAGQFAKEMSAETDAALVPADSLADALTGADIVICTTWSRYPFLFAGMVLPGTHITSLGADDPNKNEVAADLIRSSRFFCDDRDLALSTGALSDTDLGAEAIHAELGEVIAGHAEGRRNAEDITIFAGVGLAVQDLVAAWQVYRAAEAQGIGQTVDFVGR